jgi:hypothetical protein
MFPYTPFIAVTTPFKTVASPTIAVAPTLPHYSHLILFNFQLNLNAQYPVEE